MLRSESNNISDKKEDSVRRINSIFSKHFWMFVNKIREQKLHVHCGTSCKAPTDNKCGNESKNCLTSK